MFYDDVLNEFKPKCGIIQADSVDIERSNGASRTEFRVGDKDFKVSTQLQHYRWSQSFIGLKCKIIKKYGNEFVKEFNIANLIKKLKGWDYLTEKRIDEVKEIIYALDGRKVEIDNTSEGYRIVDLPNILLSLPPVAPSKTPSEENQKEEKKEVKKKIIKEQKEEEDKTSKLNTLINISDIPFIKWPKKERDEAKRNGIVQAADIIIDKRMSIEKIISEIKKFSNVTVAVSGEISVYTFGLILALKKSKIKVVDRKFKKY